MTGLRSRRIARVLGRGVVYVVAAILVVVGLGVSAIETSWGKNQIRRLIVSQANRFLTGTLEIDQVGGSIFRGIRLEGVRLLQDGIPIITIEEATVAYSIRELYEQGTVIRRLTLHRLHVVGAKDAEGRWNLGKLVRSRPPRPPGQGPPRPITFQVVELTDAAVEFRDPLMFGAAHVPSRFDDLQASFAFELQSPAWRLDFTDASWRGRDPELSVSRLAGGIGTGPTGWSLDQLRVETARSAFTVAGEIRRQPAPTTLALTVAADRFAFQEWGGVLTGLRNIAIESAFSTELKGPLNQLATTLELKSNGGAIQGTFVLDSSVPGWHGAGSVDVATLNLAPWLNRPDRPSNITGHVGFDLDLELGQHFPRGAYTFTGPHAAYLGYEADQLTARGTITRDEAVIAAATTTAYGANVHIESGAIGIDAPFRYRFRGRADGVDLRRLPPEVPMPHVESTLVLDFDVNGRFTEPFLTGSAVFGPSEFLGAQIGEGTVGSVDTSATPVRYAGTGDIGGISLRRFGDGLDVAWMRDPRYDGLIAGRFHVEGAGADSATMTLSGGGRLTRAELFEGVLSDAEVGVEIAAGSLAGRYDGRFDRVNPARAFDDPRLVASLTGSGQASVAVRDLLTRTVTLDDYTIDGTMTLEPSTVRTLAIGRAEATAHLADQMLSVDRLTLASPSLDGTGSGVIALDDQRPSQFDYDVTRGELSLIGEQIGRPLTGILSTQGRLTGTLSTPQVTGAGRLSRVTTTGVEILTGSLDYEATIPTADLRQATGRVSGLVGPLTAAGQALNQLTGAATLDRERLTLDLRGARAGGMNASLTAELRLDTARRTADISAITVALQDVPWQLAAGTAPHVAWDDAGVSVTDLALTDHATGRQRLAVSGDWRSDGNGALRVVATGVSLDGFSGTPKQPARYGGRLDADATLRPASPNGAIIVTGTFTISEGRVRRLSYQALTARVDYSEGIFTVNARLDQAPGVWLTAIGTVPLGLVTTGQPDLPMNVAVTSSPIELGILEGVTDVVHDVSGQLQLNVTASGPSSDPQFDGTVDIAGGSFAVRSTGARYKNARLAVTLSQDNVTVRALHVEDAHGHTLDVSGSLGTRELRVGDLAINAKARQFEVLRNEFGTTEVDAELNLSGRFLSPRLAGSLAITGGELKVDEILERTLLHPYATEAAPLPSSTDLVPAEIDALVALNPWERLGLDLSVRSRGTLHMVGDNVQVSQGTPLGLGNVNLRAFGELYLYKDPAQPLSVTGSFDSLIGTYSFQGRRFDLDPDSSIVFRGDLNPELYVTVRRTISGVETRVSIVGPLDEPELRLGSTPRLDDSDILSLIVFNTSLNQLTTSQQQELAVRAGTLAAGFLATPIVTALERSLGLDILEIDAGNDFGGSSGPKVTIGDEIAPGLVARFSRQFGQDEYSEATIEYFLSRLFRIRATFSDASAIRSPFRRVERAGIDLLLFFSF